uniref:18S rRNA (guanine-N(7))-methyltransferase n=1 Tax=Hirondellea gigas TaxID=1518452 RepID=A0A2P2HY55_9CRUS
MGKSSRRPEHQAPPEIYYNDDEAKKYTQNSRIIEVQTKCTVRALELLNLPVDEPALLLDLGCGSGLSGEVITEQGHQWIGMDISTAMLDVALDREVDGGLILSDLGEGLPFRPAIFNGAISISTLQWLCNADRKDHIPARRLSILFRSLFACLTRGSRAVFQFYPESEHQVSLIVMQATKAGFTGGVVVDFPNSTKAKKMYLVLMCGGAAPMPQGLQSEDEAAAMFNRRQQLKKGGRTMAAVRERIKQKKDRRRRQGKTVHRESKYTGRPRSSRF